MTAVVPGTPAIRGSGHDGNVRRVTLQLFDRLPRHRTEDLFARQGAVLAVESLAQKEGSSLG
ncbi:hypothetical protein GCM10010293_62140 [Streptomyces griseoflavus]|nr:hypothetical protein GCM10010293_62140 [Streptomyces griseoflavus]